MSRDLKRDVMSELENSLTFSTIEAMGLYKILELLEVKIISIALENAPSVTQAAAILKIPRTTLFMKMKKLGIAKEANAGN
jgi:transcriptional regulator with PAS, ATPase and Fis domain